MKETILAGCVLMTALLGVEKDKTPMMTLKDAVDYTIEYQVEKVPIPPTFSRELNPLYSEYNLIYGVTHFGTKQIVINNLVKEEFQKFTLLHELYHVHFDKLGLRQNEKEVDKAACELYKTLYEARCPNFEQRLERILK